MLRVQAGWRAVIHSANPTVQRREERLLRERLAAMEAKVDVVVRGAGCKAPSPPTSEDAPSTSLAHSPAMAPRDYLTGSHVETQSVDTTTPLQRPYGATYTTVATSVTLPCLQPMTPEQLLITGLVSASGKFSPSTYERLLSEVPGMVKGRLMGPREAMLDKQRAAQKAYPGLWHA